MLRNRSDWRLAALQGMAAGLPGLSEAQLGAAMVAAVKLELQPPVQWVQVRGERGCTQPWVQWGLRAVGVPGECRTAHAMHSDIHASDGVSAILWVPPVSA